MDVIYDGKTKRVLRAGERMVLQFKDTITGDVDGSINPGGNFVVGSLKGKSAAAAKVAAFFFKILEGGNIDTHFCRLRSDVEIEVRSAERIPLEVIYRAKAYGSFLSRYRGHVEPMTPLDLVEFTLKDDALGDPLIMPQSVVRLKIASEPELQQIEAMACKAASLVQKTLTDRGLELIDMKLEFGRADGKLMVVDELSGDTMRVYDPVQKKVINQLELAQKLGLPSAGPSNPNSRNGLFVFLGREVAESNGTHSPRAKGPLLPAPERLKISQV